VVPGENLLQKWGISACRIQRGIKGDEIPIESRIIALADSYDAMTSSRPYREEGMSLDKARQELINCAGAQFDPSIVDLIIRENLI